MLRSRSRCFSSADRRLPDELGDFVANLPTPVLPARRSLRPGRAPRRFPCSAVCGRRCIAGASFPVLRRSASTARTSSILQLVVAAAGREPAFHKVGLFANEADVEHGQEKGRINWINKISPILKSCQYGQKDAPKPRDFARARPHTFCVDELKLLGVALGLACFAGVNLYLTVFVTGLAIHQHWIVLSPDYQSLSILGDPLILWISGTLYVLEFFADKIPWVDSIWDTVHTIIRPIGGALLAIRVLGQTSPTFEIVVALAAGSASLVTHSAKASTRLVDEHFARAVLEYRSQPGRRRGRRRRARTDSFQSALGAGCFRSSSLDHSLFRAPNFSRGAGQALAGLEKAERTGRPRGSRPSRDFAVPFRLRLSQRESAQTKRSPGRCLALANASAAWPRIRPASWLRRTKIRPNSLSLSAKVGAARPDDPPRPVRLAPANRNSSPRICLFLRKRQRSEAQLFFSSEAAARACSRSSSS